MKLSTLSENIVVYLFLVQRNLKVVRDSFFDNVINSLVITGTLSFILGYLMNIFGLNEALISPIFLGMLVFVNVTTVDIQSLAAVHDLDTKKFIVYLLTLPAPKKWVIGATITSTIIELISLTLPIIIFGKLILGSKLALYPSHLPSFLLMYLLGLLYMASLSQLLIFSFNFSWFTKNVFPRIYLPLLYLGSVSAPLSGIQEHFPRLTYLYYLSPLTYLIEGWRSVLLGSTSIPLFICIGVLSFWILFNLYTTSYMLKKKHGFI